MDKPISVGDLVMVTAPFCVHYGKVGYVFTVSAIEPARNYRGCEKCSPLITDGRPLAEGDVGNGRGFYPLSLLKRIPPLEELDDVKKDEEITA
jgi:hypothetical protein